MTNSVVIAVDAMGGDNAPQAVLDGVKLALSANPSLHVLLCGNAEVVEPFAANYDRCTPVPTTQVIEMDEHPANAVRSKKDSSIVVACRLVKEQKATGIFSAGSTGAVLAAATLVIGRVKGVMRPMLATMLPAPNKPILLCDCGANADCKPEYLNQFAQMACVYMRDVFGVAHPKVGLLNIGAEETKGSQFALDAYELLKQNVAGFAGNIEGDKLLHSDFDIVVTDGFTGNVCLKTIEGTAHVLFKEIKSVLKSSFVTKIGALTLKSGLTNLAGRLSADTYGGAPLIGVNGACVVGHGNSEGLAVCNGILATADFSNANLNSTIYQIFNES